VTEFAYIPRAAPELAANQRKILPLLVPHIGTTMLKYAVLMSFI
jgi:hypothetical protein